MNKLKDLYRNINAVIIRLLCSEQKTVDYINGADSLPPPLSKDDEQKAFKLLETDEKKARELLIVHNLRLVVYIAKNLNRQG